MSDIMNGLIRQEPYSEQHAVMNGPGLYVQLILKTPNNKDFTNLKECEFYKNLETFQYHAITDSLFGELYYLRDKVKDYCYAHNFVTYGCELALELLIYDERDRIRRC